MCILEPERLRGSAPQVSPQCNQSPPRHKTQGCWITPSTDTWFDFTIPAYSLFLADKERTHSALLLYILQERKIIINFMPEKEGGTMAAQPHGPASPTPCTSLSSSYDTHSLPHQDTVLHMNSGLNSIQLGLCQQINRSPSSTGNDILGPG